MGFVLSVVGIANYFFAGFVFMKIWNWFPQEIFNIIGVGYAQSLGLLLLLTFFKTTNFDDKDVEKETLLARMLARSIFLVLLLGLGFIIQAFI